MKRNINTAKVSRDDLEPRDDETLGHFIRRVRLCRALTPAAIADATTSFPIESRLSCSYLSQLELGLIRSPSTAYLRALAQVLEISLDWLIEKVESKSCYAEPSHRALATSLSGDWTLRATELKSSEQEQIRRIIEAVRRAHFA
jgi:transcriptional regulator with XRE-family HTH domain